MGWQYTDSTVVRSSNQNQTKPMPRTYTAYNQRNKTLALATCNQVHVLQLSLFREGIRSRDTYSRMREPRDSSEF